MKWVNHLLLRHSHQHPGFYHQAAAKYLQQSKSTYLAQKEEMSPEIFNKLDPSIKSIIDNAESYNAPFDIDFMQQVQIFKFLLKY